VIGQFKPLPFGKDPQNWLRFHEFYPAIKEGFHYPRQKNARMMGL